MQFNLYYKKTFYLFSFIILFLLIFDLASYFYLFTQEKDFLKYYDTYFNMEYERNVPTFFSVLISFLTGVSALMIYKDIKKNGWLIVSIFFIYFALDDALSLHEYIGSFIGERFFKHATNSYYWQITFLPMFAIVGLYVFIFLFFEFKKNRCTKCMLAIFLGYTCYAVAVGMDYYEGLKPSFSYVMDRTDYFSYRDIVHVLRVFEEAIEMLGATLILSAILLTRPLKITLS